MAIHSSQFLLENILLVKINRFIVSQFDSLNGKKYGDPSMISNSFPHLKAKGRNFTLP